MEHMISESFMWEFLCSKLNNNRAYKAYKSIQKINITKNTDKDNDRLYFCGYIFQVCNNIENVFDNTHHQKQHQLINKNAVQMAH